MNLSYEVRKTTLLLLLSISFVCNCWDAPCSSFFSCSEVTCIVNCSHRGVTNSKSFSQSFNCSLWCGENYCQTNRNIALKIVYTAVNRDPAQAKFVLTLNVSCNRVCYNKSVMLPSTATLFGLNKTDPPCCNDSKIESGNISETILCLNKTDDKDFSVQMTSNITSDEFSGCNRTENNVMCCDACSSSHVNVLETVSGFNGSNNHLTQVPSFAEWSNLTWIDLSNNCISVISRSFGNLSSLQLLILRNNSIKFIHRIILEHLLSLKYVHLNVNPNVTDWSFLKKATNLDIIDIRGSCNKELQMFDLSAFCSSISITLITDNTSCIQNVTDCRLLSSWPTLPISVSLGPCVESSKLHQSNTTATSSEVGSTQITIELDNSTSKFCTALNSVNPFLTSVNKCILIPLSGAATFICIAVVIVTLFRWRMRVKRQGRYSKWLSVYSRKSSDNECQLQIKHEC